MRKIIICVMLLVSVADSFSQNTTLTSSEYLAKSKKQKTTATILTIGGTALLASQLIVLIPGKANFDTMNARLTAVAIGAGAAVWGIILFSKAAKNKAKAKNASAFINLKQGLTIEQQNIRLSMYPAVSFKLNL